MKKTQGKKFDNDKPTFHLLEWDFLAEVNKVLELGAKKYGTYNWQKGLKYTRTFNAIIRHMIAFRKGEDKDPETGLSHLAHITCNCMFLFWFQKNKHECDDRREV